MANFPGGSVYGYVHSIATGVSLITERSFKRLSIGELQQLGFELDKQLRSVRGDQPSLDDTKAVQNRQRMIQRLNQALIMLRAYQQKTKRKR